MKTTIDERNDTEQICSSCNDPFDNRAGHYGMCYSEQPPSVRELCLCEDCIKEAVADLPRGAVKELDSDVLSPATFTKLFNWVLERRSDLTPSERALETAMQILHGGLFDGTGKLPPAESVAAIIEKHYAAESQLDSHGSADEVVGTIGQLCKPKPRRHSRPESRRWQVKIVVIPTQAVETKQWGLWSNRFQCWMHKEFRPSKRSAIIHAKHLGFTVAGLVHKGKAVQL